MRKQSKAETEEYLNGYVLPPRKILKSNGGPMRDSAAYGSWLRRNDPKEFDRIHNNLCRNQS